MPLTAPSRAEFQPPAPGLGLVHWLLTIQPVQAPVIGLAGGEVPVVRRRARGLSREIHKALAGEKHGAIAATRDALVREPLRRDGYPAAYRGRRPRSVPVVVLRDPEHRPQASIPFAKMVTAFAIDIENTPTGEVIRGHVLSRASGDDAHRALRRYENGGRRLLAELGAWPWTLFDEGRLPLNWWAEKAVSTSLRDWCADAVADVAVENHRATRAVVGAPVPRVEVAGVRRSAREAYLNGARKLRRGLDDADSGSAGGARSCRGDPPDG